MIIDGNNWRIKTKLNIDYLEKENMLSKFGEKAILINPVPFCEKVECNFLHQDIKFQIGEVSYEDNTNRMEKNA